MPYRPLLSVTVEFEGAEFIFASPDNAMADAMAIMMGQSGPMPTDPRNIPPALLDVLVRVFTEGVVDWQGVEGDDGRPLPCNDETKRAIPFFAKVEIASQYFQVVGAQLEGKAKPPAPPTN